MLFGICIYTWLWDDLLLFRGPSSTKWDEITCILLLLIIVLHDVSRVNTTRNMWCYLKIGMPQLIEIVYPLIDGTAFPRYP